MDANGRLIISKDGKPKFVGETFEETGVKEEFKQMELTPEEKRQQQKRFEEQLAKLSE